MKKLIIVTMALLFSFSAFAEIKIGGLFAVTGPAAYLGQPEKQTLEMLVEQINANGGINGEKIVPVIYDTQGEESRTIQLFKRLVIKDKVIAVLGPTRTGSALAIKDLAEKYQVPLIACAASKSIVDPVSQFVFKTPQSDVHVAEKLYEYLVKNGKTKIAIITAQSGYGSTGRAALFEVANNYPVQIIIEEKFRDTDKDMTSQLTKIKEAKPDAVICWGVGPAPAIVAKNAKQLGITELYMTQGVASPKFIELAGDAAEGMKLTAGRLVIAEQLQDGDKFKDVLVKYKNDYESKFNMPVSVFGGHAFDAFYLFYKAYKPGMTSLELAKSIEQIQNFYGTAGEFNLTQDDHVGLTKDAFIIVEIKDGQFKYSGE